MKKFLLASLFALGLGSQAFAQGELTGVYLRNSGSNDYPQSQWNPAELPFTAAGKAVFDANKPTPIDAGLR